MSARPWFAIGARLARLRGVPASIRHVCPHCHGILKAAKAGFFDLGSLLTLEADGSLRALRPAAELFTPYLPATAGAGMVAPVGPAYLLRKELGLWRLVFDRKEGVIEDGRGMQLAAYLLKHPPAEPLPETGEISRVMPAHRLSDDRPDDTPL